MKTYLGDSVYAEFDGFGIILTTENGFATDPSNKIVMEPEIISALNQFYLRAIETAKEKQHVG